MKKLFRVPPRLRLRVGNRGQPRNRGLSTVEFSKRNTFTFHMHALDVADLGMQFRLIQWGTSATGCCDSISMCYLSPSHETPQKAAQLELDDLKAINVIPDPQSSADGRQEAVLAFHQRLYPSECRESWFLHMHKQALTLDAFSGVPAVLDFWIGPRRRYWIWRAFLGQVAFQALFSGFEELDARDAMRRLVRVTPDSNLADWHDREQRAYMRHLSG